jgi:hypothetical protein
MKQGKMAYHNNGCVYRTPDGMGCAVGILLSDEDAKIMDSLVNEHSKLYSSVTVFYINRHILPYINSPQEEFSKTRIQNIDKFKKLSNKTQNMIRVHHDLLTEIQGLHDSCFYEDTFRDDIKDKYRVYAKRRDINFREDHYSRELSELFIPEKVS